MIDNDADQLEKRTRIRIFISSPGDVRPERALIKSICDRLQLKYSNVAIVEGYLWERQFLPSHEPYQYGIAKPSSCDVFVMVLWWRLGTDLLEPTYPAKDFRGPISGRVVTGTEWEFEEAKKAHVTDQNGPQILICHKVAKLEQDPSSVDAVRVYLEQREKLKSFFDRNFPGSDLTLDSPATANYPIKLFHNDVELIDLVEPFLDRCVIEKLTLTTGRTWFSAPYLGFQSYGPEDAGVFSGRSASVSKLRRITEAVACSSRMLIVTGASGSGKSSLVKAGLVPLLLVNDIMMVNSPFGIGSLRGGMVVIFNAIDSSSAPLNQLKSQLNNITLTNRRFSPEANGQIDVILDTVTALVSGKEPPDALISPGERFRSQLFIVLDQAESLLRTDVSQQDRQEFNTFIELLLRTKWVTVIATVRSEFVDDLASTFSGQLGEQQPSIYWVDAPTAKEIGQIVRDPMRSSGILFQPDEDGTTVDAEIVKTALEVNTPLPLLSILLSNLARRVDLEAHRRSARILTWEDYRNEGADGVPPIIAAIEKCAESAISTVIQSGSQYQIAFNSLIRRLTSAEQQGSGRVTVISRPYIFDRQTANPAIVHLIRVLEGEDTRVLIVEARQDGLSQARLSHDTLISHWPRVRALLGDDIRDLVLRDRLRNRAINWLAEAKMKRRDRLLRTRVEVSEADDLLKRWETDLTESDHELVEFITASSRNFKRQQTQIRSIFGISVLVLIGLTSWAIIERETATEKQKEAEDNFRNAKETLLVVTDTMSNGLRHVDGVHNEAKLRILRTLENAFQELTIRKDISSDLRIVGFDIKEQIARSYFDAGLYQEAIELSKNILSDVNSDLDIIDSKSCKINYRSIGLLMLIGEAQFLQKEAVSAQNSFERVLINNNRELQNDFNCFQRILVVEFLNAKISGNVSELLDISKRLFDFNMRLANSTGNPLNFLKDAAIIGGELSSLNLAAGNYKAAEQYLSISLDIYEKLEKEAFWNISVASGRAIARFRMSDLNFLKENYAEAERYLVLGSQDFLRLSQVDPTMVEWDYFYVRSLIGLYHLYLKVGESHKQQNMEELILTQINRQLGSNASALKGKMNLTYFNTIRKLTFSEMKEAIELAIEVGDENAKFFISLDYAINLTRAEMYVESEEVLQVLIGSAVNRSQKDASNLLRKREEALARQALGDLFYRQSKYSMSIQNYTMAEEIFGNLYRESNEKNFQYREDYIRILKKVGNLYINTQQWDFAAEKFSASLSLQMTRFDVGILDDYINVQKALREQPNKQLVYSIYANSRGILLSQITSERAKMMMNEAVYLSTVRRFVRVNHGIALDYLKDNGAAKAKEFFNENYQSVKKLIEIADDQHDFRSEHLTVILGMATLSQRSSDIIGETEYRKLAIPLLFNLVEKPNQVEGPNPIHLISITYGRLEELENRSYSNEISQAFLRYLQEKIIDKDETEIHGPDYISASVILKDALEKLPSMKQNEGAMGDKLRNQVIDFILLPSGKNIEKLDKLYAISGTGLAAEAVQLNRLDILLLLNQINPTILLRSVENGGSAALLAARSGREELIRFFMTERSAALEARWPDGQSALSIATQSGSAPIIKAILDKYPGLIDVRSKNGATPLIFAAEHGNLNAVKALLDFRQSDLYSTRTDGVDAMMTASWFGNLQVVDELFSRDMYLHKRRASSGRTAFLYAVENKKRSVVEYLLKKDRSIISDRTTRGIDAWLMASISCDTDMFDLLLLFDEEGLFRSHKVYGSPVYAASRSGQLACVEYIYSRNRQSVRMKEEIHERTALWIASVQSRLNVVKFIYEREPESIHDRDIYGMTPLMASVLSGKIEVARYLIQETKNLDTEVDFDGHGLLYLSAHSKNVEMFNFIYEKMPESINQRNKHGRTPIYIAIAQDALPIVERLLKMGANLENADSDNRTPMDYAEMLNKQRSVELIKNEINARKK